VAEINETKLNELMGKMLGTLAVHSACPLYG
jgi:hypothetical protein